MTPFFVVITLITTKKIGKWYIVLWKETIYNNDNIFLYELMYFQVIQGKAALTILVIPSKLLGSVNWGNIGPLRVTLPQPKIY